VLRGRNASTTPGRSWTRWATNLAIAGVLFAISLLVNLEHLEQTEMHPDETRWLNRAYYIREVTDPFGQSWQDYYITRGQPPGGSYLMGLGLLIQGQPLDSNGVWDFHFSAEWNELAGAVPDHDVLMAGRRTNAVVGALVVALAFAVASCLTNRLGGVAAGLFLAFHPLHITLSTQALSDELLALTLGLAFLAAFRYGRNPSVWWTLVMGVALGVGGATKLAPLGLAFVLAGYGLVWLVLRMRRMGKSALRWPTSRFGALLLLQPAIAGFVFVAMYPFLWPEPIRRSLDLLEFRRQEMASQARIWSHARVDNPKDAFMRYGEQLDGFYSTTKDIQTWLADVLGTAIADPVSYDFIAVLVGGILLLRIVIQRGLWSPHGLTATLMAAEIGAVTVGLGVDFYRYYLPVLLVNSVLVGIAFGEAYTLVRRLMGREVAPASRTSVAGSTVNWPRPAMRPGGMS
jgi:hypothetical protein